MVEFVTALVISLFTCQFACESGCCSQYQKGNVVDIEKNIMKCSRYIYMSGKTVPKISGICKDFLILLFEHLRLCCTK